MFAIPSAPVAAHSPAHKTAILASLPTVTGWFAWREWSKMVAKAAVTMNRKADSAFNAECRGAADQLVREGRIEQNGDGLYRLVIAGELVTVAY